MINISLFFLYKMTCRVTGELHCKCYHKKPRTIPIDVGTTLRKLFTDHAVYTRFVILSIENNLDDIDVMLKRLLINQDDIGEYLGYILGKTRICLKLSKLLKEHILLAGRVIKMSYGHKKGTAKIIKKLFANGDKISELLHSIAPEKLPLRTLIKMFRMHNKFVISMVKARLSKSWSKDQKLYDAYYNEMLDMANAIISVFQ